MRLRCRDPLARRLIPAIVCFLTLPLPAATYHVDATRGADKHSGLSPAESWKTLEKVNDIAKNAMIIRLADEGVIEHNVCWDTAWRAITGNTSFSRSCRGTVFQFNEGYLNRSRAHDGSLYDADLESPGCIFQYSYSHDNAHGLFWMCTVKEDAGVIVRCNISRNDKGSIFCINYPNTSCYIYNNVIFIPPHLSPRIIDGRRKADKTYTFTNNIIYNLSPTASYHFLNGKRTISHNVFYGHHPESEPADPHKITDRGAHEWFVPRPIPRPPREPGR